MVSVAVSSLLTDPSAQQADNTGISQRITNAIHNAAAKTGVNFAYLLNKAQQESGLDPNAKASTSSATGLFQFTGQTWMQTLKAHGAQYGLSDYADHISTDNNGVAHVKDPTWRNAILALRSDPQVSAEMAGELDKENGAALKASVGGKIGATDLYLAHFLGAGGASDFLKTMHSNPNAPAANILPDAAAANESVFYNADGTPRSVSQIYDHFAQKFDHAPTTLVADANGASQNAGQIAAQRYAMASATSAPVSGNYVPSMMNSFKADGSSLFATMMLAQMHMGDTTSLSMLDASQQSKKNAISILGATA